MPRRHSAEVKAAMKINYFDDQELIEKQSEKICEIKNILKTVVMGGQAPLITVFRIFR